LLTIQQSPARFKIARPSPLGRLPIEAKAALPHGQFTSMVRGRTINPEDGPGSAAPREYVSPASSGFPTAAHCKDH
jgi:hypothetical protein